MLYIGIGLFGEAIGFLICMSSNAKNQKKIDWLEQRVNLTNSLDYRIKNAGEKSFTELPIGIIVYNNEFQVEWANTKAKKIFNSSLVDRKLSNLYGGNLDSKDFEKDLKNLNNILKQMNISQIEGLSKIVSNLTKQSGRLKTLCNNIHITFSLHIT